MNPPSQNEYALKRRRPYHTGDEILVAGPAFAIPDFGRGDVAAAAATFPAMAAAALAEPMAAGGGPAGGIAGLYMFLPEEHHHPHHVVTDDAVASAIYNSLDLTAAFDPSFGDFGNLGTAIGDLSDIFGESLPLQTAYPLAPHQPAHFNPLPSHHPPPPPPPPPNPRKRQRSISDQDMPRMFYSRAPAAEKALTGGEWTTAPTTADPGCSDSLMACFPGALARWKDFCAGYGESPHPHGGMASLILFVESQF
jgi:hypothetical protein